MRVGFQAGLVVVRAMQDHLGTEVAGGRDLDQRRRQRHDDDGADAPLGGVVGDSLRVVAGARGDHTPCALLQRERGDAVERAPLLEGARHLQVFELQEDLLTGERGQRDRVRTRGEIDGVANALTRRQHIRQADGCDHPPRLTRPTHGLSRPRWKPSRCNVNNDPPNC